MDTLIVAKTLKKAGFNDKQSEVLASLFKDHATEKRLIRLEIISIAILGFGTAAFGYVISLLNTIVSKL